MRLHSQLVAPPVFGFKAAESNHTICHLSLYHVRVLTIFLARDNSEHLGHAAVAMLSYPWSHLCSRRNFLYPGAASFSRRIFDMFPNSFQSSSKAQKQQSPDLVGIFFHYMYMCYILYIFYIIDLWYFMIFHDHCHHCLEATFRMKDLGSLHVASQHSEVGFLADSCPHCAAKVRPSTNINLTVILCDYTKLIVNIIQWITVPSFSDSDWQTAWVLRRWEHWELPRSSRPDPGMSMPPGILMTEDKPCTGPKYVCKCCVKRPLAASPQSAQL